MEKRINQSKKGIFVLCLLFIITLSSCFRSNYQCRHDRDRCRHNQSLFGFGYSRPPIVRVYAYKGQNDNRNRWHGQKDRDWDKYRDHPRNRGKGRRNGESRGPK